MATDQSLTERGMAVGLRALNKVASSGAIDRLGLRDPTLRLLHHASKTTGRTAARAGRTFAAAQRLSRPARQPRTGSSRSVRPRADRRAAAAARLGQGICARRAPRRRLGGRCRSRRAPGAARAGQRARPGDGRGARGARRRRCGARGDDDRPDERGARARRHGDRGGLSGARGSLDRAQPVGRRPAAGDLPAGVRRRGRPRRGARGDGTPAAVQPVRAVDERPPRPRRL